MNLNISSWIKLGIDLIKTPVLQWKARSHGNPNSELDSSAASERLVTGRDSIVVQPNSQISIKIEDSPSPQRLERHDGSKATEGSATDGISRRPDSQIGTGQELERRRDIVRQFFNDFWNSADHKPVTFAERLNRAEGYINGRLAARGEVWQLDPVTRKQLGLPPSLP
jgi:hypothetical protein